MAARQPRERLRMRARRCTTDRRSTDWMALPSEMLSRSSTAWIESAEPARGAFMRVRTSTVARTLHDQRRPEPATVAPTSASALDSTRP
jgi:hypothetical protein